MKKRAIPAALAALCLFTACGSSENDKAAEPTAQTADQITASSHAPEASSEENSGVEVICAEVECEYLDYETLTEQAAIIMTGEYADGCGNGVVKYREPETKKFAYDEYTFRTVKADKVLKGADRVGEDGTVRLVEPYAFCTNSEGKEQLLISAELAPMEKGTKAIFILTYNKENGCYMPYGSQGRFPMPADRGKTDTLGFTNGLAPGARFQADIYTRLIEEYKIS